MSSIKLQTVASQRGDKIMCLSLSNGFHHCYTMWTTWQQTVSGSCGGRAPRLPCCMLCTNKSCHVSISGHNLSPLPTIWMDGDPYIFNWPFHLSPHPPPPERRPPNPQCLTNKTKGKRRRKLSAEKEREKKWQEWTLDFFCMCIRLHQK